MQTDTPHFGVRTITPPDAICHIGTELTIICVHLIFSEILKALITYV